MLETDEINVYECHENSLIVDKYLREDVWPTDNSLHRDQFEVLLSVKQDLFRLFDTCKTDIQDFLKNCKNSTEDGDAPLKFSENVRKAVKLQLEVDNLVNEMENLNLN